MRNSIFGQRFQVTFQILDLGIEFGWIVQVTSTELNSEQIQDLADARLRRRPAANPIQERSELVNSRLRAETFFAEDIPPQKLSGMLQDLRWSAKSCVAFALTASISSTCPKLPSKLCPLKIWLCPSLDCLTAVTRSMESSGVTTRLLSCATTEAACLVMSSWRVASSAISFARLLTVDTCWIRASMMLSSWGCAGGYMIQDFYVKRRMHGTLLKASIKSESASACKHLSTRRTSTCTASSVSFLCVPG